MELDPSQFLAGGDDEDEDDDEDGDDDDLEEGEFVPGQNNGGAPQILNALGLRTVNPLSMLSTDLRQDDDDLFLDDNEGPLPSGGVIRARCSVCNMGFSNRANARRHEKNKHGIRAEDANSSATVSNGNNALAVLAPPSNKPAAAVPNAGTPSSAAPKTSTPAAPVRRPAAVFDYSKPEKFRHLLTESRIMFIRQNAQFLFQYQNMTCNCCRRQYFTYKTFMAHTRKKYPTLPRLVCYNCLRKFETKGQFIAHLKKRSCINLFTLFMADPTMDKKNIALSKLKAPPAGYTNNNHHAPPVKPPPAIVITNTAAPVASPAPPAPANNEPKLGLKELLSNKVYACRVCKEHLRLKNDFRQHVMTVHADLQLTKDPVTGNCTNCDTSLVDPMERKRHVTNLDCVLEIICTTCDSVFETNAKFLDHVYGTHLKEVTGSEKPPMAPSAAAAADPAWEPSDARRQSNGQLLTKKNAGCVCPVCHKQYNNYYNVLWHFESKHPELVPKTYKCELCDQMFTKQALLKSHVKETHADVLVANAESKQALASSAATSTSGKYPCRHCEQVLPNATEYVAHQTKVHPEEELLACHECEFVTEERPKLEEHLRQQHLSLLKMRVLNCGVCKQSFVSEDALKYHTMVQHAENESSEQLFKRLLKHGRFPAGKASADQQQEEQQLLDNGDDGDDNDDELLQDTSYMARVKHEESQRVRECPLCVVKFEVLAEFIAHMNGHETTDGVTNLDLEPGKSKSGAYHSRMRCRMCEKRISSKVGYKRHLLEAHGVNDCKIVQCDLCPGEFSNDKGLKAHLFRTHNITVKDDGDGVAGSSPVTVKREVIEYECQICHTVYRSLALLRTHVGSVHQQNDFEAYLEQYGNGEVTTTTTGPGDDDLQQQSFDPMSLMMMTGLMDEEDGGAAAVNDYTPIEVYFQCRYCDDHFASRQKLTAHMNTHEEHDPHDYTCRECGNVYQSRKSLWVHRNKKHPNSQVPSPCEVCKKVFFDKTELVYHLKTHVAQKMELMNELMSAAQNGGLEDVEDDDDDTANGENGAGDSGSEGEANGEAVKKYDCHVCERKFRDPGKLSQHLRFHEMQNNMFVLGAFTEAGMDDDEGLGAGGMNGGGGDATSGNHPFEPQYNDDGQEEYQCDMCPKKFNQLMALRVHRGWHYRSPDGRQITEPGQTWQPGSLRSQRNKNRNSTASQQDQQGKAAALPVPPPPVTGLAASATGGATGTAKMPKCQYCSSTFASTNNLRRHIVEVHKRNDFRQQKAVAVANGQLEKERECSACNLKFETRAEWVEHKIGHARVMRPSTTFEWNCDMCGKVFTRKERLLQHMTCHASDSAAGSLKHDNSNENSREGDDDDDDLGEEEEDGVDAEPEPMVINPDVEMLNDDFDGSSDEEDDSDGEEEGEVKATNTTPAVSSQESNNNNSLKKSLCCDLCQLQFTNDHELRKHVMSHFFNGGAGGGGGAANGAGAVAKKTKLKDSEDEAAGAEGQQAKRAKIDSSSIPEAKKSAHAVVAAVKVDPDNVEMDEDSDDDDEDSEDGGGDLTAGDLRTGAGGDEDLDEGEYVEEYLDEESIVSPKKPSAPAVVPAKTVAVAALPPPPPLIVKPSTLANCRVCSSSYENNFKALKCMESHRQRSKYQCSECELYFGTTKQMQGHQQLMHGGVVA